MVGILRLGWTQGMTRSEEPISIYFADDISANKRATVARIVNPDQMGVTFVRGTETHGECLSQERITMAVKMTHSPEMWDSLAKLDEILDSIRSHSSYREAFEKEGLWEEHDLIKKMRKDAIRTGRKFRTDFKID
jgi:hypothetical protein